MRVIMPTSGVPIKNWATNLEAAALAQATNIANLPFVFKHVALMPDAHSGYGMPIGGVCATRGVVVPNMVGVDIGCGMGALKFDYKASNIDPLFLKQIIGEARKRIPVGFNKHSERRDLGFLMPLMPEKFTAARDLLNMHLPNAGFQLGTLGGGNHFIELQADEDDNLWVMLHSGSRNLGKQVADFYHKRAVALCEMWHVQLPTKELAFLPLDTQDGQEYLHAMNFALAFAEGNRAEMLRVMAEIVMDTFNCYITDSVNIHHNFAQMEHHYGENVMVHRKGATLVREGTPGIIPGSMGTSSYIVEGLGNPESFNSCSHGAGRRMGRKEACRSLNLDAEMQKMGNVVHGIRNQSDLEEAPGAYKDIDVVMEDQRDLVKILYKLRPLASLKG